MNECKKFLWLMVGLIVFAIIGSVLTVTYEDYKIKEMEKRR